MPDNRFIHPKLGHSKKVCALTDLEFRVWVQYLLSADDFGVMRCSTITIQAGNDALHDRPTRTIQRALDRLIDLDLVAAFDHQGQRFLCQLDWHRWQRFNLPSSTNNPAPPTDLLTQCEDGTATLFYSHHPDLVGIARTPGVDGASTGGVEAASTPRVDAADDAHQITANGTRRTGHGTRNTANGRDVFVEFWKAYPRKVGKEAAWRVWQRLNPSAELLAVMLAALAWQRQQPQWVRDGGQYVPHPSTWLNQGRWQDEPPAAEVALVSDQTRANLNGQPEALRLIAEGAFSGPRR